MPAVAHRHNPQSLCDSAPNLGEQHKVATSIHTQKRNSSPKLGEVARRADGVCKAEGVRHPHTDMPSRRSTMPALTHRHTPQSLRDSSPNLGEQSQPINSPIMPNRRRNPLLSHLHAAVLVLVALVVAASCASDELLNSPVGNEPSLQLNLSTQEGAPGQKAVATQSQTAGLDSLNENLIQTLDVYLYVFQDGTGYGTSIKHIHLDGVNQNSAYDLVQTLTPAELRALLPDGSSGNTAIKAGAMCYAYVIANAPADIDPTANATMDYLKSTVIESSGFADWSKPKQDQFIMDGEDAVTLYAINGGTYTLRGAVILRRAAAKMDMVIHNIQKSIVDENGFEWSPDMDNVYISFFHGVKRGNLNPDNMRESDKVVLTSTDYFDFGTNDHTRMRRMKPYLVTDAGGNPIKASDGVSDSVNYTIEYPFYSYPRTWTENSALEPYFSLTVPWQRQEWNEVTSSYDKITITARYQIPIRTYELKLDRNCYYRTLVDVSVMGTLGETDKVEITNNTYIVIPWTSSDLIPIDMREIQFLAVQEDTVAINNQDSAYTTYASSHDMQSGSPKVIQVRYTDYSQANIMRYTFTDANKTSGGRPVFNLKTENLTTGAAAETDEVTRYPNNGNQFTAASNPFTAYTPTAKDGTLTLKHSLDLANTYTPYEVTVELTNTVGLTEQVVFTIYPPIYIQGHKSDGKVYVNGWYYIPGLSYTNYRYRYNNYGETTQSQRAYNDGAGTNYETYQPTTANNTSYNTLGQIRDPSTITGSGGTNNNQNLYMVKISALSDNTYMIGDPRGAAQSFTNIAKVTDQYRPASTEVSNMIAPAFMIASSYGKGSTMTYENAQQRCAAYQEDGYPAGRWRIPTEGEIEYVIGLSTAGIIPSLFSTDSEVGYWASSRRRYYGGWQGENSNPSYTGQSFIRCVYDIWYWGDEHQATNATWGADKTNKELWP